MKLFGCKLLTDENIHPVVLHHLRLQGCDVEDVHTLGLAQAADEVILSTALREKRVILTHDRDFGRLAIAAKQAMHGVVFLRPGHIDSQFTVATLEAINGREFDLSPSFILVARRRDTQVQLRLRRW